MEVLIQRRFTDLLGECTVHSVQWTVDCAQWTVRGHTEPFAPVPPIWSKGASAKQLPRSYLASSCLSVCLGSQWKVFREIVYLEFLRKCVHEFRPWLKSVVGGGRTNALLPYILESNPHTFYSFRGLKNQMRIRFAVVSWILEK